MMQMIQLNKKKQKFHWKQKSNILLAAGVDFCFLGDGSYVCSSSSSSFSDVKPVNDPRIVNIGSVPKSSIRVFNADGNELISAIS